MLRAPKDNEKMAWPKGTEVMYHSSTAGKWIDAHIEQFNAQNGTYNLDVRQEADADKVLSLSLARREREVRPR